MTHTTEQERANVLRALEESQSLLAAMLHEVRPAVEIQKQMLQNRDAIEAARRAPAVPVPQCEPVGSVYTMEALVPGGREVQHVSLYMPLPAGTKLYAAPQPPEAKNSECWCESCRPQSLTDMRFIVCPDCGNKRCPKANNHANACTNSNAQGQKGSSWEHVKPFAKSPAPQPPEADMGIPISQTNQQVEAPVQLPEPVAAESRFTTFAGDRWRWCTVEHARAFGADKGYEVRYLYTEQQVRDLLAAHGIRKDKA